MPRLNKLLLIFLLSGCSSFSKETGKIGMILLKEPGFENSEEQYVYKDKRYIVNGKGCMLGAQFSTIAQQMVESYNSANPAFEDAIGIADIEYEYYLEFIIPCMKMKGVPIIQAKKKYRDMIPVELNYL